VANPLLHPDCRNDCANLQKVFIASNLASNAEYLKRPHLSPCGDSSRRLNRQTLDFSDRNTVVEWRQWESGRSIHDVEEAATADRKLLRRRRLPQLRVSPPSLNGPMAGGTGRSARPGQACQTTLKWSIA
jgi:hypothetical protein